MPDHDISALALIEVEPNPALLWVSRSIVPRKPLSMKKSASTLFFCYLLEQQQKAIFTHLPTKFFNGLEYPQESD